MARAPLKWTNVNSRDTSKILQNMSANAAGIGSSISNLGTIASDFGTEKTGRETDAFIASIMGMEDTEARQAALVNADKSFLNLGRIADKTYELGADERALETQLNAEKRLYKRQDEVNLREVKQAEDLAMFQDKINDQNAIDQFNNQVKTLGITNKYDVEARLYDEMVEDERIIAANNEAYTLEDYLQKNRVINQDKDYENANSLLVSEDMISDANLTDEHTRQTEILDIENAAALEILKENNLTKEASEKIKLELENQLELKKIELNNKLEIEKEKLEIEKNTNLKILNKKLEQGTGLKKILYNARIDGLMSVDQTDFDNKDREAYEKTRSKILSNTGMSAEKFDEWAGNNITFTDNRFLNPLLGMPNEFSFEFRGQTYKFGKSSWTGLDYIFSGGGTDKYTFAAMEAAVISDKLDKAAKKESFDLYERQLNSGKVNNPIKLDPSEFNALWNSYLQTRSPGQRNNAFGASTLDLYYEATNKSKGSASDQYEQATSATFMEFVGKIK